MKRTLAVPISTIALFLSLGSFSAARDKPAQVLDWPNAEHPVLRFTIAKITRLALYAGRNTYALDTSVQNLGSKRISHAGFSFYLFDKNKVRIGEGYITIRNVGPNESVKMQISADAMGVPTTISVLATDLPPELQPLAPPKAVSITVYSVPSGAQLKVDGADIGMTPIAVRLTVGTHQLVFNKEGFATGTFPMVISPDQLPGGSVSFELGGTNFDTINLRDGSTINGDVESVDATNVIVRVGGKLQNVDRNQVKQILFIQRESVSPAASAPK